MTLLHHQIRGQGKPIVLIHGLLGSLENLGMVAKPLSEERQVISVDVRNHGNSFHQNSMRYDELAADVIALLNHLGVEKADILGHSMGGKIAMEIALNHPTYVDKLIVADIAPVAYPAHHQKIIEGLLAINTTPPANRKSADEMLAHYVETLGVRQFLLRNLKQDGDVVRLKCNIEFIANCYSDIMTAYAGDNHFDGETLFIKGGDSNYITAAHREIIVKLFPNSLAKIISGAGHWLHAEKTIAFNKIVTDFLI